MYRSLLDRLPLVAHLNLVRVLCFYSRATRPVPAPKRSLKQSGLHIALVISLLVVNGLCFAGPSEPPTAHEGLLDLRQVDFGQQTVELRGEWKWYWHELRSPDQAESPFEYGLFPQLWSATSWHGQPIASQGYATYSLTVLMPHQPASFMLRVPDQYTAYRLFVNGKECAHDGHPGTTAAETQAHWSTQLVAVPASTDTLQLLLQVANFQHAKGGGTKAIRLGEINRMKRELTTDWALDGLLAGCLLMGGLFFLGLFGFSRTDRSMLYFSLFCLTYTYRIVGTDQYLLHSVLPDLPWLLTLRLEHLSLYISVGLFVVYTQSLYPKDTYRPISVSMAWVCFLFATVVLLTPPIVFTRLINPFLFLMVGYIGYASYVYWVAAHRKRSGATYSLIATGILLVVFSMILLKYFGLISPPRPLLFVGYLGFFFLQSLVLPFRFAHALQEARRTETQFLANMSHEIRTPLNAIIGFSNLLESTRLDQQQQEFVGYIHTAGKNLLSIVNDVLDITKLEAGMVVLEEIPFSIHPLADSIRAMFLPMAAEKNLELIVDTDSDLPPFIVGDPTRLTQILLNLVTNAIKFTQQGSVAVRLEKRDETTESLRVRVTVTDTGIGMDADVIPHIFFRFRQANDSTTRQYGGTGLGLSIVKHLVELQGGWIRATSEPGQGSCFTLEIPYQKAPDYASQTTKEVATDWDSTVRKLTILVVEDNPINQKLAVGLLTRLGHTAQVAEDGQQALDYLRQASVDLILMDIQMPVMDGYLATHHIRNTLHLTTPIIAMTAHAMASERQQCLQAGMNDFLSKPFSPRDLQRLIQQYGFRSPMRETVPEPEPSVPIQTPDFSLEPLTEALGGDLDSVAEILTLFLDQTPPQLQQIRQAVDVHDAVAIGKLLHSQKPIIQLLSPEHASRQLQEIESLLSAQTNLDEVTPLVHRYLSTLEANLAAIEQHVHKV